MVYFVGAGTGATDLITVRGMRLLEKADVIIYAGSLVNPGLLAYAGEDCEIHNSAKLTLKEVIQIISDAETKGKTTVRLHTGEPSIYGAVREQMDALDTLGISYESCPGVSACFGAAASLNLEYTLPGISQSLIITRMEGRTQVPDRESIESFAAHKTSMAIYLSAGMIRELSRRLVNGGYPKTTPAALVYKATWEEEEVHLCTIETLYEVSAKHGITKTALILVGDAITHQHYRKSRLYAPDFSTGYREKNEKKRDVSERTERKLSVISFTENGKQLSQSIAQLLEGELEIRLYTKYEAGDADGMDKDILFVKTSVGDWTGEWMQEQDALLFIGACGIAVRAAAPHLTDKLQDAPVLVMDEKGKYVIPVLSGHMGGANELANQIAAKTGAQPVLTTATDLNQKFAVDLFAKRNRLYIANKDGIAKVSSKVLAGKEITMSVEDGHKIIGKEPGIRLIPYPPAGFADVVVTSKNDRLHDTLEDRLNDRLNHRLDASLLLLAREYVIGFGCKRGKNADEIDRFITKTLKEMGIFIWQIFSLSSVSQKREEQGILTWCRKEGIPFFTYTSEELQEVNGNFTKSLFVKDQVGVDNVCERAAIKACGEDGTLILTKTAENGMTIAIAKREWKVCFDGE